jgi:hypothetical protein
VRFERDFETAGKTPLARKDHARLVAEGRKSAERSREDAIACYLAAADGCDEARAQLGGAFAEVLSGLKESKRD